MRGVSAYHEVLDSILWFFCRGDNNAVPLVKDESSGDYQAAYRSVRSRRGTTGICWYNVAVESEYPGHIPREC